MSSFLRTLRFSVTVAPGGAQDSCRIDPSKIAGGRRRNASTFARVARSQRLGATLLATTLWGGLGASLWDAACLASCTPSTNDCKEAAACETGMPTEPSDAFRQSPKP